MRAATIQAASYRGTVSNPDRVDRRAAQRVHRIAVRRLRVVHGAAVPVGIVTTLALLPYADISQGRQVLLTLLAATLGGLWLYEWAHLRTRRDTARELLRQPRRVAPGGRAEHAGATTGVGRVRRTPGRHPTVTVDR